MIGRKKKSSKPLLTLLATAAILVVAAAASADEPVEAALRQSYENSVRPFFEKHCLACHGQARQEAKLDLSGDNTLDAMAKRYQVWELVLQRLADGEMPPEEAPNQPTEAERKAILEWLRTWRQETARRNAGDPGPVLARRLSNAEYDYTIRDLTGVDLQPTREFPVDPANEAGFDNSGESLSMSPALVKKYLAAARLVADHLVLKPQGFVFAPHPAVTETDRDKYCVQRIIDFYKRHEVDYADYFQAAWRYQNREALAMPGATVESIALEARLSPKYLATIVRTIEDEEPFIGPLAVLRTMWFTLPPAGAKPEDVRRACERLRDFVVRIRKQYPSQVKPLRVQGISEGSQPLVLWRNRQLAAQHMHYNPPAATAAETPQSKEIETPELAAALEQFCKVFPDAFVVSDRGPYFDPKAAGQGRLLTAGFHLMQGYFRDDEPLCELVLNDAERRELDELWRELNFVTSVPMRQYKDFIFFERAEPPRFIGESAFDFARSEDKDATSPEKMRQLAEAYLAKAQKQGASEEALEAIKTYFAEMSAEIRWIEETRLTAEPGRLEALAQFAARAYRRPLASDERAELLAFYHELREQEKLSHEDALRDVVASILMSPYFCYRFDLAQPGDKPQALSPYELASRLSYFLWSSMPDDELLAHAAAGDLAQPEVLAVETRRMLQDERIRGLATQFAGNWLEFRDFAEHNAVDRERFPAFTNELRQAMFEEPLQFFLAVARDDRSVLDFLDAEYTFVNPVLARHYGLPSPAGEPNQWTRIDHASDYGRGGLLPMAVFLTKNAPGLRTSPVKRGYWVVRRLLGEHIPPPPPEVPELPKDEATLGELTLPQVLAKHREHKNCAACHERFDSIGLAFEGYGPIGEQRERDLGGRPVETRAVFPDGSQGEGLAGLRRYLRERCQEEFIDNLCRKLLAYGLGRTLLLSDDPLIENMKQRLAADDYRFACLIETIVASPQFLHKRGDDAR